MRSFSRLAMLIAGAVLVASCSAADRTGASVPGATPETPEAGLDGFWHLRWIEVGEVRSMVAIGRNASAQPWIHFTSAIEGNGGCNGFRGLDTGIVVEADRFFIPDGVVTNASLCLPDGEGHSVMAIDRALHALLGSGNTNRSGVEFTVEEGTLTLVGGAYRALFDRADGQPTHDPPPPPTSFQALDCSPRVIHESRFVGDDLDPIALLMAADPEIVSHRGSRPFWFGLDAGGEVIAAVAEGDIRPVQWQVFACVDRRERPDVVPVLRVEAVDGKVGDLGRLEFSSDGTYRGHWKLDEARDLAPVAGAVDVAVLGPLVPPSDLDQIIELRDGLRAGGECPHVTGGVSWYLYFYDTDGVPRIIGCELRFDAGDTRFQAVHAVVALTGIDEAQIEALADQVYAD